MFCSHCGTSNIDSGKFCMSCGTPLTTSSQIVDKVNVSKMKLLFMRHKILLISGAGVLAIGLIIPIVISLTSSNPNKEIAIVMDEKSADQKIVLLDGEDIIKELDQTFSKSTQIKNLCFMKQDDCEFVYFFASDKSWNVEYYWDYEKDKLYYVSQKKSDSSGKRKFSENIHKDTPIWKLAKDLILYSRDEKVTYTFIQTSIYKDISMKYDIRTELTKFKNGDGDSSKIKITFLDKMNGNTIYTIQENVNDSFGQIFKQCDNVRSYSTGKNEYDDAVDGNYGFLVVADLNFDNKEDFALMAASFNTGPLYSFYTQNSEGKFVQDKFLNEQMMAFPSKINKYEKTLTQLVRAGCCELRETVYTFDAKSNIWKEVSNKFVSLGRQ